MKKNILILLGRGVEGCGVTKFTIEQVRWLQSQGHYVSVVATKEKSWTRKLSHDTATWKVTKFSDPANIETLVKIANIQDFVIINSLPSQGHPEKCIAGFISLLNQITVPVVLIQHDHSSLSIKRNAAIDESIAKAALLFGHSKTNDFATLVQEKSGGGGLASFFDGDDSKEIVGFQPGMDFDAVRAKYWKPIDSPCDVNHHKWIGRTTSWKGYVQMFKLHNEFLRKAGCITSFEGIERSPAYLGFRTLSEFNGHITDPIETIKMEKDQPVYVFGPYKNDEMLERMSQVAFGYQLSILPERFIERSIEYTHCEVACTGVVPVFRKRYGQLCTHRKHGYKLINCPNNGTIWLDDYDMQPAVDLMMKIAKDPVMRDEWRNMAFEFYKSHQDAYYTFAEMQQHIDKLT
jgi:hypothetical protein